jgi:hypothetical protein
MILGRPINLWTGLITSIISLGALLALSLGVDPTNVAQFSAAFGLVAGAVVLLVANGNPSMLVGQQYTVVTPDGQDNVVKIANPNPTPPSIQVPK